jgi:hypothetical protein
MINEHDIEAFKDEIWETMSEDEKKVTFKTDESGDTILEMGDVFTAYTQRMAEVLAKQCDQAWHYDAANLIRQTAGIPVSVVSDTQLHMKLHPEDDPE